MSYVHYDSTDGYRNKKGKQRGKVKRETIHTEDMYITATIIYIFKIRENHHGERKVKKATKGERVKGDKRVKRDPWMVAGHVEGNEWIVTARRTAARDPSRR